MESITVPATLDSLASISDFITRAAVQAGLDDHASWQTQLAVDEAATNIIQHGYDPEAPGQIQLAWRIEGNEFVVTLHDRGRRFNPDDVTAPDINSPLDEREVGGLGIYLMSRLMDSVQFEFDDQDGNLLIMKKRIASPSGQVQIFELSGRLDAVNTTAALEHVQAA